MKSIHETLSIKYTVAYGSKEKTIKEKFLKEVKALEETFDVKDALRFCYLFQQLEYDLGSQKQKLWRQLIFCHLTFLLGKRVLKFDIVLLRFVCDVVRKEHIGKDNQYLYILGDVKLMEQVLEHAICIDFSSSLTNSYRIDMDRIKRIFAFLCRKIEELLEKNSDETDLEVLKKQILKQIKNYQSQKLYKRSVTI